MQAAAPLPAGLSLHWESVVNCACAAGRSAAKEAANFSRSRTRYPSRGGNIGGTGAPGAAGDERVHRLALVRCERCGVDDGGDPVVGPRAGISEAGSDRPGPAGVDGDPRTSVSTRPSASSGGGTPRSAAIVGATSTMLGFSGAAPRRNPAPDTRKGTSSS